MTGPAAAASALEEVLNTELIKDCTPGCWRLRDR